MSTSARTEAIKVAPVIRTLEDSPRLKSNTMVTGQHRLLHLERLDNVVVTEPLAYGKLTRVLAASTIVLTRSSGERLPDSEGRPA